MDSSTDFTTGSDLTDGCSQGYITIVVFGTEYHALGNQSVFEFSRSQISNKEHLTANELFRFVPLADAADDGTVLQTIGNTELQEFLHLIMLD